jgi:hypothetical protein
MDLNIIKFSTALIILSCLGSSELSESIGSHCFGCLSTFFIYASLIQIIVFLQCWSLHLAFKGNLHHSSANALCGNLPWLSPYHALTIIQCHLHFISVKTIARNQKLSSVFKLHFPWLALICCIILSSWS